jgi:outer membrane protein assembly factor BamD (BamD/ComL family)
MGTEAMNQPAKCAQLARQQFGEKSNNNLHRVDSRSRAIRFCWFAALSATVINMATGCTMFSANRGSLKDYEDAKRSIENPSGFEDDVTRPEGKTAEKDSMGKAFLQKLGLQKARRRDIELARREYREGDELFESAKTLEGAQRAETFRKAAKKYQAAAKNWQSSGLEQDALMMSAESHFFAEDYYRAEEMYAKLVKEYPRNPYLDHVDTRRFEIADYWLKYDSAKHQPFVMINFVDNKRPWNDTGGHGRRVLENMRLDNPTGRISDDATMRLGVDQFEKKKYEGAADTFGDLRMTYPDSEHQFQAQFLELQALMNSYRGPKYSSVPLDEAEKRVKQIVRQFPTESRERHEDLTLAFAKIRFNKAQREWTHAEYRRLRQENGSARFYYQRVVSEYGDTPFAQEAEQRLKELEGEPDDPPQRFGPLVKLFGQSKSEQALFQSDVGQ